MSALKNYSAGEPTSRLYVKNLAKHVEDKVDTTLGINWPERLFLFLHESQARSFESNITESILVFVVQ
jgi:hypothetical protein